MEYGAAIAFLASTLQPRLSAYVYKYSYNWQSSIGYASQMYEGIVYPPFMKSPPVDVLRTTPLRPSDIVIATYPKCGTTLMQQIVLTLLNSGNDVLDPMGSSPWAEMIAVRDGMEALETRYSDGTINGFTDRRVIKTHAPRQLVPWKEPKVEGAKVIVISRNPADTAVSMYHHSCDIPSFQYSGSFRHFLCALFIPGKVESGCFWEWHRGWRREWDGGGGEILWVTFEEFKDDPRDVVTRVAGHIGLGDVGEDVVGKTIEGCSFGRMKANAEKVDGEKMKKGLFVKKNHIRKGMKGAWRKKMTEEEAGWIMGKQKEEEGKGDVGFFEF